MNKKLTTFGSTKEIAARGMFWTAIQGVVSQVLGLVVMIVLGRLLRPEDFGLVGMIAIFISISSALVGGGMGNALVQKTDLREDDYSTVFIFNFSVSLFLYWILFLVAPLISRFYDQPQLILITRVLGLLIVINSFGITQSARLTREMDFKTHALIGMAALLISGSIAITAACMGYGVWTLVIQQLVSSIITIYGLYRACGILNSLKFSKTSFKSLFGFGSNLLAASIYAQIFQNLYNIVLGKFYSAATLGFYTRAKRLSELGSGLIAQILHKVTYPLLCSINEDEARLISVYSRLIRIAAFIVFPTMTLASLLAEPLIRTLLGEAWLESVFILQVLAIARITYPISVINMNILNAKGRSDLFLKVDLLKAPMILIILAITIPFGIKAIIIGQAIGAWISFFINAYLPGKLFGYGGLRQIKDMLPFIGITIILAVSVLLIKLIGLVPIFEILASSIVAFVVYISLAALLKIDEFIEIRDTILDLLKLRSTSSEK